MRKRAIDTIPPLPFMKRDPFTAGAAKARTDIVLPTAEEKQVLAKRMMQEPDMYAFDPDEEPPDEAEYQDILDMDIEFIARNPFCKPKTLEDWWDELCHLQTGQHNREEYQPHAANWGLKPEFDVN